MKIETSSLIIIALIIYIVLLFIKRKRHPIYVIFWTFMFWYLVAVVGYTLLPIHFSGFQKWKEVGENIDLKLFNWFVLETFLLNILLTVPLGFGYPFVWKKKIVRTLLLPFVGLGIELSQLFLHYFSNPYTRVVDVTDVLSNGIGVILGLILFYIIRAVLGKKQLDTYLERVQTSTR